MDPEFFQHIFDKQQQVEAIPSNKEITNWALQVIRLLYPEHDYGSYQSMPGV
jgi:serine O-acetyltransferase